MRTVKSSIRGVPLLPILIIWPVIAILFSLPLFFPMESVIGLQFRIADALFLNEGGPLLGTRPIPPGIVLIMEDEKTYRKLGNRESNTREDLLLYQAILKQGPLAVGDTRPLFADTPGVQQLLDGMVASSPDRLLLREVLELNQAWPSRQYLRCVGHNFFFVDSATDVNGRIRFYPLLGYRENEGFYETMALKLARAYLNFSHAGNVPELARACGIAWAWSTGIGLPPEKLPESIRKSERRHLPYPLGPKQTVPWTLHPSRDYPGTVSPAVMWINYLGPPGRWPVVPFIDVLNGRIPASFFHNKIVVVGSVAYYNWVPGSTWRRATEAEIAAETVQTISTTNFMRPLTLSHSLASIVIMSFIGMLLFSFFGPQRAASLLLGLLALNLFYTAWQYRHGIFPDLILAPGALVASGLLAGGYRYALEEISRRNIADLFSRYVPRAVVAQLLKKSTTQATALGGVKREITVLFADIRGFTAFSESLPPEQALSQLNIMLRTLVDCAFRYEGTVDKYIGDAIMVLFNAPMDQPDHPLRVVRAALDMQRALADENSSLSVGIGIHTGEAVVGNVGTPERLEYTAIGRTVNLAARLCDAARGGEVVISDELFQKVRECFKAEQMPPLRMKGFEMEVAAYRVTGQRGIW